MPKNQTAKDQLEKILAAKRQPKAKGDPAAKWESRLSQQTQKSVLKENFQAPRAAVLGDEFDRQKLERERLILSSTMIEELRELGKEDFWSFVTLCVYPHTWKKHYSPTFHYDLVQIIQTLKQGENVWFFLPREFRKSFLFAILRSLWMIIRDPDIRLLLIGAREETVKPFARLIISAFVKGTPGFEHFQMIYPDYTVERRSRNVLQAFQFTHPLRKVTLPDPTFRAAYLGVTGAGWRCDVIDYDDAIERRNVTNPEQSGKSLRQMLDLLPLVDTGSQYRNIIGKGTRYVYHDPYGRIIGDTGDRDREEVEVLKSFGKTTVVIRHALENPDVACTRCPKYVLDRFPHGEFDLAKGVPPDAPVHTRKMILERYQEYLMDPDKGESMFYHQYGNICLAPKDQKFMAEWCQIRAPFPNFNVCKQRVLSIDSADKDFQLESGGDFMVALFGEFDDFGRLLLVYGLRSNQWSRAQFIERIITWCQGTGWWPHKAVKEKFGQDNFMTDLTKSFMERQKPVMPIVINRPGATNSNSIAKKQDWIVTALQGPMERAEVIWGAGFPEPLRMQGETELTLLGQLRLDDMADAMSMFMVEGVRVKTSTQYSKQAFISGPSLDLYGAPPAAPGAPSPDPFQEALRSPRIMGAGLDLNEVNREVDPKNFAPKLDGY